MGQLRWRSAGTVIGGRIRLRPVGRAVIFAHTSETKSIGMTRVFDEDLTAGFGTRAIHAGQRPEPLAGAIMTPVYLTSTYVQEGLGQNKGYEYARGKNPTREAFERNVASLENGRHGFAFSSGMGCLDSIMKLFSAGRSHRLRAKTCTAAPSGCSTRSSSTIGLSFSYVDTRDPQRIADAMTPTTRAILVETPTNPLMRITDIAAVAEIAHRAGALLIVDNTFASPFFQRPLELGADIVYHSTTKYLNGHSDMIGGCAIVRDDGLASGCSSFTTRPAPCRARSTPGLRCAGRRRCTSGCASTTPNGREIAKWLVEQVGHENVYLHRPPDPPAARPRGRQMSGFGGMISVELGTRERAAHVLEPRAGLLARRVAGRRRVADQPAGRDDPRFGSAGAPRRDGSQRRA